MHPAAPVAADAPEHSSAAHIALHPLVIVNIADHASRNAIAAQQLPAAAAAAVPHCGSRRAVGCLLGVSTARRVDIHTSFELTLTPSGDVDAEFLRQRRSRRLEVFPEQEVVGWYVTGRGFAADDVARIHSHLLHFTESPLALVMDTEPAATVTQLPVFIFTSCSDDPKLTAEHTQLRRVTYTVESEETERIGVEAAMRADFSAGGNRTLAPAADRLQAALEMLRSRIRDVAAYLRDVLSGAAAPDYVLLRRIAAMTRAMPDPAASSGLRAALTADSEDAVAVALLGVVAKGSAALHKLLLDVADEAVAREPRTAAAVRAQPAPPRRGRGSRYDP